MAGTDERMTEENKVYCRGVFIGWIEPVHHYHVGYTVKGHRLSSKWKVAILAYLKSEAVRRGELIRVAKGQYCSSWEVK